MPRRKLRGIIPTEPSHTHEVTVRVTSNKEMAEIMGLDFKNSNKVLGNIGRRLRDIIIDCGLKTIGQRMNIRERDEMKRLLVRDWNRIWAMATRLLDFSLSDMWSLQYIENQAQLMAGELGIDADFARCLADSIYSYAQKAKGGKLE